MSFSNSVANATIFAEYVIPVPAMLLPEMATVPPLAVVIRPEVVRILVSNPAPLSTAVGKVVACMPINVQFPDRFEALVLLLLSFLQATRQKKIVERIIKPPD